MPFLPSKSSREQMSLMMVWGKGGRREGPAKLMNHITVFMEIPTASHVLFKLGHRAVDLLFPEEPTNHNLLSSG